MFSQIFADLIADSRRKPYNYSYQLIFFIKDMNPICENLREICVNLREKKQLVIR